MIIPDDSGNDAHCTRCGADSPLVKAYRTTMCLDCASSHDVSVELVNPANGDRDVQKLSDLATRVSTGGRWSK